MPKLQYDCHYGALIIFPFFFSWLSLLVSPFLILIKDHTILKTINQFCFYFVYFPLSLCVLVIFMTVNAVLIPFAYVKTVIHKALLLGRYRSKSHYQNLAIFICFGILFLTLA